MSKDNLTILIYTSNSEKHIKECVESLKDIDAKLIAIDLESTDKTLSILRRLKIPVKKHKNPLYVEPARNFGITNSPTDWVFIIDDDERMTPELAEEIEKTVNNPGTITHFKVARKEMFARKKWLRHGWWPNFQVRLIHKPTFVSWPEAIHSTPKVKGNLGYLKHPLIHFSQNEWSDMVEKTIRFEGAESKLLYDAGRSTSTAIFFKKFFGELYRRLIKQKGFMDGTIGILESVYQAFSKTITWLFVYEKNKKRGSV